ncbi:MAG: hypothetical protein AB8B95_07900 [Pseudohongiellaceae bacterium]
MHKKSNFNAVCCWLLVIICVVSSQMAAAQVEEKFIQQELERVGTDPENSVTILVDAPVEFVFKFLMERLDLYTEDAVSVSFDVKGTGEISAAVGTERTTVMASGETLVQRFLQMDAYNSYAYFTDISKSTLSVPLKYSLAKYDFVSLSSNKTQVKISVVYQPSSRLTAFIVRRLFNSAFERDFNNAATMMSEIYSKAHNQ